MKTGRWKPNPFNVPSLEDEVKPKPLATKIYKPTGDLKQEWVMGKGWSLVPLTGPTSNSVTVPKPTLVRKEGEIWRLNSSNSPFGSEQWAYQGSAKSPYVITHYGHKKDGAVTQDGWACSCMNFTRNVPRTPCKHILNVMLKENPNLPLGSGLKASAKLASVDDKKLAQFEKWEREQAAKGEVKPTAGAKLNLFGTTTRKFR